MYNTHCFSFSFNNDKNKRDGRMKTFSDIIEKNNSYTDYYNEEPSIRKSDALKATKEAVTVALELIVMKQSCIYPAGLAYDEIMSVLDKMEGIK